MTTKELNRDVKRLRSEIYRMSFEDHKEYMSYLENEAAKEFKRLYHADKSFFALTKDSVLTLLRLNLKFRFIPLHTFGIDINLYED